MKKISHKARWFLTSRFTVTFFIVAVIIFVVISFSSFKGIQKSATVLFVGDMMFDRTMRTIGEAKGYDYLFSCTKEYLNTFDAVVGNLEGPITENVSQSSNTKPGEAGNTTFTFDEKVSLALFNNNIRFVNLGNNHIFDFGRMGAESTKKALAKNGIVYFGVPGESLVMTTVIHGTKIAFVNFNQFLGENDPQKTIEAIWKARKESDYIFVYAHWGDEYILATEYVKSIAHRFVDAGADVVIGSHPHVIQEYETYGGKHVFYSLGNFIFDQYWNEEVRTGGGVEVTLSASDVSVKEVRFDISRDGRTCLKM